MKKKKDCVPKGAAPKWPAFLFLVCLLLFAGTSGYAASVKDNAITDDVYIASSLSPDFENAREKKAGAPSEGQSQVILDKNIKGKVTGENGETLPGVSVVIKGTQRGTITNNDGNYDMQIPDGETILIFSFIGYTTKEVSVPAASGSMDVVLAVDNKSLEEVVVVGYGSSKKETLSGSITTVKGTEILQSPAVNVSNSLAGRMAGVTAVTRSGEPGRDGTTIRVRGINTLGDNSALIVVDGVPGRSLDRIDPYSIESITVLKDASAAIYGSQAANGVILITTKRGASGKPQVSLSLNQGIQQPTRLPSMTNAAEYATALNEVDSYRGRPGRFSDEAIQKFADGSDPWRYPNTDWFDVVFRKWSPQTIANMNVSGGGESVKYFVSVGAKNQGAMYNNSATKFNQYDFRTNLDAQVSKHIKLGFDMAARMEDRHRAATRNRDDSATDLFWMLMLSKPTSHGFWPNGMPGPDLAYGMNPVVIATDAGGYDREKNYVVNSNFRINVTIPGVEGLSFTGNASLDKTITARKRFQKPWYLYSWDGQTVDQNEIPVLSRNKMGQPDAALFETMGDVQNILLNGFFNYEKTIGLSHNIKFLAGMENRRGNGASFGAYRRYFASAALDIMNVGGGDAKDNQGTANHNARMNYFGRVNYNFKEKYLAEFVWRVDGSYIFPETKRYGFFPGLSLGWRLSEEEFWKTHLSGITTAKLRASVGKTGNDRIAEWQYLTSYGITAQSYIFDKTQEQITLAESRIPNPNVTWEVANQSNLGIDLSFLKGKLYTTLDVFQYKRSQMLWQRNASVPASTGLTLPRENIGKMTNRGFDFEAGYDDKIGDVNYRISVNGGYAKNKITFWDEAPGAPEYQRSTGRPAPSDPNNPNNDLYYEATGVYKNQTEIDNSIHWPNARPGDIIFKDVNEDGVINANDRVRNKKGDIPTFQAGLGLNVNYKGFDLSFLFQGAAGAVRFLSFESTGDFGNYLKEDHDGRWTPENTNAEKPRASNRLDEYWRANRNTFYLRKTDYVRLKNLELGYTLPPKFTQKLGMQNLRIYVNGSNLLTYSPDLTDFDPEDNHVNGYAYPLQRVVNGGILVTF